MSSKSSNTSLLHFRASNKSSSYKGRDIIFAFRLLSSRFLRNYFSYFLFEKISLKEDLKLLEELLTFLPSNKLTFSLGSEVGFLEEYYAFFLHLSLLHQLKGEGNMQTTSQFVFSPSPCLSPSEVCS